jgi:hypothetical protein
MCVCIYIHTYIRIYIHKHIHTYTYTHTYIHTHTHARTHARTHTHTHTHTASESGRSTDQRAITAIKVNQTGAAREEKEQEDCGKDRRICCDRRILLYRHTSVQQYSK